MASFDVDMSIPTRTETSNERRKNVYYEDVYSTSILSRNLRLRGAENLRAGDVE